MRNLPFDGVDHFLEIYDYVLIDIWADWCAPCKKLTPLLEGIEGSFPKVAFAKAEADKHPTLLEELKVKNIPTVVLFRRGEPFRQIVGLQSLASYTDSLDEMLGNNVRPETA